MFGLVVDVGGFVTFVWPFCVSLLAALTHLLTSVVFKLKRSTVNGALQEAQTALEPTSAVHMSSL